jgi:HK97 gp10 family phage protein
MPLSLTIGNLDKVLAEIKSYPKDIEQIINNEFRAFGEGTRDDAISNAPVNEGRLRESINYLPDVDNMQVSVGAYIDYAAYLEFGTKSFAEAYVASLPEDWQAFAAEHQGTGGGGTFDDLLIAIINWVIHKGIGETLTKSGNTSVSKDALHNQYNVAYLIALKIVRNGIKAQPFLYPAFEKNKLELIEKLKAKINIT